MVKVLALTLATVSKSAKPMETSSQSSQIGKTYTEQEYNAPKLFVLTECKLLICRTRTKGYQQEGPEEDHEHSNGIENNRVDTMRNTRRTVGIANTENDNKMRVSNKPTMLCIYLYLQIKMKILLFLGINKCISSLILGRRQVIMVSIVKVALHRTSPKARILGYVNIVNKLLLSARLRLNKSVTMSGDLGADNNEVEDMDISTDDDQVLDRFSEDAPEDSIEILASSIAWYKPWAVPDSFKGPVVPREGAKVHPLDPRGQKKQPLHAQRDPRLVARPLRMLVPRQIPTAVSYTHLTLPTTPYV